MKAFRCRVCDSALYFENSRCIHCGTRLGFSREERAIVPVDDQGTYVAADGATWKVCRNLKLSGCTWLTQAESGYCFSCELTRTRPNDEDAEALLQYHRAEEAKRHLVFELDGHGLELRSKKQDPEQGLCFDLISSMSEASDNVTIGHADGVITIDLAETDDAYRERVRAKLAEPYRTMLGHFRHEVGHYFEWQLVVGELIEQARELFGDETVDYQGEIKRHYAEGPPEDWRTSYISEYATMHPWEDFAETWAHYLHISDSVETASEFGLTSVTPSAFTTFRDLVSGVWLPLSTALNQINRSMGTDDLYPFVIPAPVLEKLEFVASLVSSAPTRSS